MKMNVLLVALLAAASMQASASDIYGTANIGKATYDFDGEPNEDDTSFDIGAGYKFNSYLSAELSYRDLGGINDNETNIITIDGIKYTSKYSYSADVTALQLSVVGTYPMNDVASVFGRIGFAKLTAKTVDREKVTVENFESLNSDESESSSESKNKVAVGVGAEFEMSDDLNLRFEYLRYAEWDGATISTTSVGWTYTF